MEVISKLCKDGHRLSLVAQWVCQNAMWVFGGGKNIYNYIYNFFVMCGTTSFWAVSNKLNKIRLRGWLTWKSGDVHDCHTCPIKEQYVIVLWVPVFRWAANVLFLYTVKNGCSSLPRRFTADSTVGAIDVSPTRIIEIVFVLFLV